MNTRILSLIALTLVLILNACSPFTIVRSSGEQAAPVEEVNSSSTGYQPVTVDHVEVEIGVGSPIPVHVIVSGSLPDICSQVEHTEIVQDGSNFTITLSATPAQEGCLQDALPFRMSIPLNVVDLPAGSYSVEVNGSRANFMVETANTTSSLPTADSAITRDDILVDSVNVEIGVGSPIPVHAVVGLSLPDTCAQPGEIRLHLNEKTFFIRLIADTAERPGCKADLIPFRLEIPLNIVNLPEGPYDVNVNGVMASFDPNARPGSHSEGESPEGSSSSIEPACSAPVDVSEANGKISYNGISFHLDPAITGSVSARICPAYLPQEGQMVNEAHPPYTGFFFPAFSRQNVDFQPEIRVYEVTGDLQSYLFPLNRLDDLQAAVEQRPEPALWFKHSPLHTRQAYLDLIDGAGVRGLVQHMQDFFFFTNNGLIYEFHGLTQDGRHFISVRYPVSVPFLMELEGISLPPDNIDPQAIAIPAWPGNFEGQRQVIEKYNTEALRLFEQMSDSDARPNLALLDQLVQSIRIGQP